MKLDAMCAHLVNVLEQQPVGKGVTLTQLYKKAEVRCWNFGTFYHAIIVLENMCLINGEYDHPPQARLYFLVDNGRIDRRNGHGDRRKSDRRRKSTGHGGHYACRGLGCKVCQPGRFP